MTDTEPLLPMTPMDVAQTFHDARARQQAGQSQEAERLYRAVLQSEPLHAEANHQVGLLMLHQGHAASSLPHLKRALKARPKESRFWLSYVEALIQDGQSVAARQMYSQAQRLGVPVPGAEALMARLDPAVDGESTGPTMAELEHIRSLHNEGRFTELESAARRLVERFPGAGSAWKLLGLAEYGLERPDRAEASLLKAVKLLPGDWQVHYLLGNLYLQKSQRADAEEHFRRCIALKPEHADASGKLGHLLGDQSRFAEAESCFRSALALQADHRAALAGLGNVLTLSGRVPEAEQCYRRMLQAIRTHAAAAGGAVTSFAGALPRQDKDGEISALCCLAYVLMIQGRAIEAHDTYQEARAIGPLPIEHDIQASLLLPPIYESREDIARWRTRFAEGIDHLRAATGFLDPDYLHMPSFYLAYQNQNNGQLMTALHAVLRARVANKPLTAPWVGHWTPPDPNTRRLRVGFLSEFFGDGHTIGKLYEGLIGGLDKSRFEVFVIQLDKRPSGAAGQGTAMPGEKQLRLPVDFASQCQLLAGAELDVLFYPDIGMSAFSYFLAGCRFAPVQVVSWGHPDTTGIDTMDYFLSAAPIEPERADTHYTERLVRLTRLPCCFRTPQMPTHRPNRAALGLPETGTLYGCPQSLFKFHPDFDAVLAAIAEGDADGHIVLLEGPQAAWRMQLRARWAMTFPILLTKVLFLPRLPLEKFMALMAHMDVLLDPLHFGSGNTLYEAMVFGTPVVTWPGQFMRGRIVSGAYRQMAVPDAPVVQHIADYAPMALALGRDPARRQSLRAASIAAARRDLYEDVRAVRELETFLIAAVNAAGRGERLPAGWTPQPPAAPA